MSFDSPIGFGDLTNLNVTKTIPVLQVVTNPGFNRTQSDPGDVGVLLVSARDTIGVTPATLPSFGLLSQLADKNRLKDAVFTAVGYGVQNRIVGGGPPSRGSFGKAVSDLEWRLITEALDESAGNQALAAKALGLKRTTLIAKIKRYRQMHPDEFPPEPTVR